MGRKSKAQLAKEAEEKSLQELADKACDVLEKKPTKINSGTFSKGNTATDDYSKSMEENIRKSIEGGKGSVGTKDDVTKMFQNNVTYAAGLLIKKMKSSKTPIKERNDIAELIINSLYGKTPLDNNIDNEIVVVLNDKAKEFAE